MRMTDCPDCHGWAEGLDDTDCDLCDGYGIVPALDEERADLVTDEER